MHDQHTEVNRQHSRSFLKMAFGVTGMGELKIRTVKYGDHHGKNPTVRCGDSPARGCVLALTWFGKSIISMLSGAEW